MKIDGEYLSNLRFDDDILQMLQELADQSENQGLKMNKSKTKVMVENESHKYVNNSQIEKLKATSTWDIGTTPETKTKTRRLKE